MTPFRGQFPEMFLALISLLLYCLITSSCLILCNPMDYSPTRLHCPWGSPGKNTEVGCHFLLQEIFPTQRSNLGLLYCRQTLYHLSHVSPTSRQLLNGRDYILFISGISVYVVPSTQQGLWYCLMRLSGSWSSVSGGNHFLESLCNFGNALFLLQVSICGQVQ